MRNRRIQRPDDGLDPLAEPVREGARGVLVFAGRADQEQAEVWAGEEFLGALAGQAFVGDHGGARCRAVGRLVFEHLPGLLAFPEQLRVGQAEPGDGPLAGAHQQQLGTPVEAGMAGAVPISRPAVQLRAPGGDHGLAARHRGGIHQPQHFRRCGRGIGQPAQRGFHQRRCRFKPGVVFRLAQQPREQMPDLLGRSPQPVPLVVITQQYLGHRQAHQFGIGHLRRPAGAAAGEPPRGDDPVCQFHVQCGQESVQIGDHDGPQGSGVCDNADPGHSSPVSHPSRAACHGTP